MALELHGKEAERWIAADRGVDQRIVGKRCRPAIRQCHQLNLYKNRCYGKLESSVSHVSD